VTQMAYEEFRKKIANLQSDLQYFKVDFLDRDSFKNFADDLYKETSGFNEISIMIDRSIFTYTYRTVCCHIIFNYSKIEDECIDRNTN
jgi:hypothetical protein